MTVQLGSDYAGLLREIRAARLLDRRRWNYAVRIVATLVGYAGIWAAVVLVGDSWYQTFLAAMMGLIFTQVAFIGHDGGHQQIARTRRWNDLLGLFVGDLLIGLSYGWWVDEHAQHHAHPNHEGLDPDIGDSVITFTGEQSANRRGPVETFIAAHQAYLFFPLLTLEGVNLHVQAIGWLHRTRMRRYRRTELVLLALHAALYLTVLLLILSPVKALAFVAIQQGVWGLYMGSTFAPNHKGMPTVPAGQSWDYLRRQVLTTRNVRGGVLTDFVLGGLNYQVEHHLFPNMPRANLRRAQPIVVAYCCKLGVRYTETSLVGSYAQALRHLHSVGQPLRSRQIAKALVQA